jgi:hypothetical protein
LVEGMNVLKLMEAVGTRTHQGIPKKRVVITECGEVAVEEKK